MRKFFLLLLLLLAACSSQAPTPSAAVATDTETPEPFATATLPPTNTPRASMTPAPPTVAPTIAPVLADLTNQVNVRSMPNVNAKSLGVIPYGTKVEIIGKDAGLQWWQIVYPENSSSTGWISSSYVTVTDADATRVPVIEAGQTNPVVQATDAGPMAVVITATPQPRTAAVAKTMFVRSGPATTYSTLGTVSAGTAVPLMGRTQNNVWILIQYNSGPNGNGWVSAAFLSNPDLSGLPYYDNQGNLISAGGVPQSTTDPNQPTLTPTGFAPAVGDTDSLRNPAVSLQFSPDGSGSFSFTNDVSAPTGDGTDWVAFTPYEPTNSATYLYLKLICTGNGGITGTLLKNGLPVPEVNILHCGNYAFAIHVIGGQQYVLQLSEDGSGGPLRFNNYTLTISTTP